MNLESNTPSPEQELMNGTLRKLLETAVDRLPETYRSVFMLRDVEGMSTADAAESLELTEDAVKVRLHRARALMRKHIYAQTGATTATAFQFMGVRCDRMVSEVIERIRALENDAVDRA